MSLFTPSNKFYVSHSAESKKQRSLLDSKAFFSFVSVLSMFFGGIIYLMWRPTTLLMFSWCRSIGIYEYVLHMRLSCDSMKDSFPKWFIFSLPQALWCFSWLCCIHAIWINKSEIHERFWTTLILIISLLAEIMQLFPWISGVYDPVDIVLIVLFYFIFKLSIKLI